MKESFNQEEELSRPVEHWGEEVTAYILNSEVGPEGLEEIHKVQDKLREKFPHSFLFAPDEALHITLMDWVAPLVDYGKDKDELFREHFPEHEEAMREVVTEQAPITVHFNEIWTSPDAVIVVGTDNGSYARIRSEFLEKRELIPGTKKPPQIIHCTIARFQDSIGMDRVKQVLGEVSVDFTQEINSFRLARETRVPMLEFEIIQEYKLD